MFIPCCPPPHDVITRTKLAISFIQSVKVPIQLFREPHADILIFSTRQVSMHIAQISGNVSRNVSRPIDRFFSTLSLGTRSITKRTKFLVT